MANLPISALDVQTTLLDTDLFVVVDTTDHSMAVTGTDKQITAANVIAGVKTALVTVPNTLVPFGDVSSDLTTDANFNYVTSTLTAPTVKGKAALQVEETGGGGDAISIVAPATIPAPYTLTLPDQVGTNGQVLSTTGLGVLTFTSLSSSAVTSFSAGTTGFTPSSPTTGIVTLGGTLGAANGGTGQTSFTVGGILLGNGSSALGSLADVATGSVLTSGGVGANPTWTAFTSDPTASTVMARDVNANTQINVIGGNVNTTATAAGITTLTVASGANQVFTGTTTQTVLLPDVTASNMKVGFQWSIVNQSTGVVTVQTNSGAALSPAIALSQNQTAFCTVVSLANNNATSWVVTYVGNASGGVTSVNTLTGALTMSQVVAVNDAGSAGGSNCVIIGSSATASSTDSISIGRATTASTGTGNIAIGQGSTASGATGGVVVIGLGATGTQAGAIAIGNSADSITGTDGIAIGTNAQNQIVNGIAIGNAATASIGANGIAIGASAQCQIGNGIAIGGGATASTATESVAVGASSSSTNGGVAIGYSAIASGNAAAGILGTASGFGSITIKGTAASVGGIAIGVASSVSSGHSHAIALGTGASTTTSGELAIRLGDSATTELRTTLAVTAGTAVPIGTEPYIVFTIGGTDYKIALRS